MADITSRKREEYGIFRDGYEPGRMGAERKRQESNLPKTPTRPPTGLKPARPTGSGTLPPARMQRFARRRKRAAISAARLGVSASVGSSPAHWRRRASGTALPGPSGRAARERS